MALTPLDIHNKAFSKVFRGYDEDEVNEFLEQVMRDYEAIIEENKQLKKQLNDQGERVSHFSTLEETLQRSIIVAQEAAEDVRHNATQEAKLIVKEAEKNADRIINDALAKSRAITIEIGDLQKQSKVFRNRLRLLVEAQLEMLRTEDWDALLTEDPIADEEILEAFEEKSEAEE